MSTEPIDLNAKLIHTLKGMGATMEQTIPIAILLHTDEMRREMLGWLEENPDASHATRCAMCLRTYRKNKTDDEDGQRVPSQGMLDAMEYCIETEMKKMYASDKKENGRETL